MHRSAAEGVFRLHGSLRSRVLSVVLTALAATSTACGGDTTAPEPSSLRFIAGNSVTDTALARPVQAVVVEIHNGSSARLSGFAVRFQALPYDSGTVSEPSMLIAPLTSAFFSTFVVDSTDASGHAAVLMQLGRHAGTARVVASVPELGVEDTATVTIVAGAAARVSMMPRDTAVYVNGTVQLRAAVTDQNGNPRTDPVTYVADAASISVSSGGLVTGRSIGRAMVIGQAEWMADTGWISVVPQGTVGALRFTDPVGVVMFNLDGSGYKWLAPTQLYIYTDGVAIPNDVTPYWSPSGTELVFATGDSSGPFLHAVDVSGHEQTFLHPSPPGLVGETWPHYSRDGSWVYFSGRVSGSNYKLWRAHGDGSAPEPLAGLDAYGIAWQPSPSPDGTRVAFASDGGTIRILDLGTDTVSSWGVAGQTPRWSPAGDQIAFKNFTGGPLSVVHADGTAARTISQAGDAFAGAFDWSPDGQWIIARGATSLVLINVQSGLTLPLGFTSNFAQPTWRP